MWSLHRCSYRYCHQGNLYWVSLSGWQVLAQHFQHCKRRVKVKEDASSLISNVMVQNALFSAFLQSMLGHQIATLGDNKALERGIQAFNQNPDGDFKSENILEGD
ncbi:unnamed protein product [Caretta caretta]